MSPLIGVATLIEHVTVAFPLYVLFVHELTLGVKLFAVIFAVAVLDVALNV